MKAIKDYENKKVLVLGLAKSGFSAAKLLHDLGALVTVNDGKPMKENPDAQELLALGIRVIAGHHPIELMDEDFALMVKNPGIPYSNPLVAKALELGLPVITEVELAYQISDCPIVGITGTNGKTTTTTMVGEVLNHRENGQAFLAGNIGFPASGIAQEAVESDVIVMELSSFQLMGTATFKPKIAAITNLYEAHLDYHKDREEYVAAKWKIQTNMTAEDQLILNFNQAELRDMAKHTKAQVIPFSTQDVLIEGAYEKDGGLYFKSEKIMAADEVGVPGTHNVENALIAIICGKLYGISNEEIAETLRNFSGVPHRTQYIGQVEGRKFYNDSKATNSLATEMALSGFDNENLILLAGGLDRGNGFDELIPHIAGLKALILFGETKNKLAEVGKKAGIPVIELTENTETAVPIAFGLSEPGDSILLSPANASWDQYPSFEIRGNRFAAAVDQLKNK